METSERYERFWAARADASLCVTKAMQAELRTSWGVKATVFHDRPPADFRPATVQEMHRLLAGMRAVLAEGVHPHDACAALYEGRAEPAGVGSGSCAAGGVERTAFTTAAGGRRGGGGGAALRPDRPALLVSGTSWTPDEDFGTLLAAAQLYDEEVILSSYPRVQDQRSMIKVVASY